MPITINKKKILIGILAFFSFVSILFIYFKSKNANKVPETPKTVGEIDYNGLIPGKSLTKDVVDALGNPIDESLVGDTKVYEYKSTNPNFNDEFSFNNDSLSFVKKIITSKDNITKDQIITQYGYPKNWLYGASYTNGYVLYVYPESGFAFIGHQNANIILEEWFFPAVDFKTFQTLYGEGYSTVAKTSPN